MQIGDQTVNIRIIGKNHDTYADGSGTAPLTFETVEVVEQRAMHSENTNSCGWEGSDMRVYLNTELIETLEPSVKNNIKAVSKTTNSYTTASPDEVTVSSDKLFLLAVIEVVDISYELNVGIHPQTYAQEGLQYEYYANAEINEYEMNSNAEKYEIGADPNTDYTSEWRLRTPSPDDYFHTISGTFLTTDKGAYTSTTALGVSFAFCF